MLLRLRLRLNDLRLWDRLLRESEGGLLRDTTINALIASPFRLFYFFFISALYLQVGLASGPGG